MNWIDDAGKVLRRAWSVRLAILSSVCSVGEVVLPYLTDIVPPKLLAGLAVATALGSVWARLVPQPRMRR